MIDREIAQKNFNVACRIYENSKALILELTGYVKKAIPDFSYDVAMRQFDLILQGVLLRVAVEDGYYLEEERQFIEKITDYADIMTFYNNAGVDVSWQTFDDLSADAAKDLSLKMFAALEGLIENFVAPFAIVDKALPKDYCTELCENIGGISIALAFCDADREGSEAFESETHVAVVLVERMIMDKWEKAAK